MYNSFTIFAREACDIDHWKNRLKTLRLVAKANLFCG